MLDELDTSHKIACDTLDLLRNMKLAATPRNIELFYLHLSRRSPQLSKDIKASVAPDGSVTQEQADRLFATHILRTDVSDEIESVLERLEAEVSKISGAVSDSGESTKAQTDELSTLSGELTATADLSPGASGLVEKLVAVGTTIREDNAALHEKLSASSEEISQLKESVASIQLEAMTDPLTGIRNRKTFDDSITKLIDLSEENDEPLSLILADVDHFKRFNDKWGHQTGDQVLRLVAEMMKANVKGQDVLARYGGEEFAIILPSTSLENGVMLADRIRLAVSGRSLKKRKTNESMGTITMSMGVAQLRSDDDVESIIERADQCLYAAKENGRNQVISEETMPAAKDGAAA